MDIAEVPHVTLAAVCTDTTEADRVLAGRTGTVEADRVLAGRTSAVVAGRTHAVAAGRTRAVAAGRTWGRDLPVGIQVERKPVFLGQVGRRPYLLADRKVDRRLVLLATPAADQTLAVGNPDDNRVDLRV